MNELTYQGSDANLNYVEGHKNGQFFNYQRRLIEGAERKKGQEVEEKKRNEYWESLRKEQAEKEEA